MDGNHSHGWMTYVFAYIYFLYEVAYTAYLYADSYIANLCAIPYSPYRRPDLERPDRSQRKTTRRDTAPDPQAGWLDTGVAWSCDPPAPGYGVQA